MAVETDKRKLGRVEELADAIAACVAKGSSDYGARRNELQRLLVEFAKEVGRKAGDTHD